MCGTMGARISSIACRSLPLSEVMMSGVVLNGTVWKSSPAIDLNSSAAMYCVPPGLVVPTLSLPGLAFAAAMRSFTDLYGDLASTTSAIPKKPTVEIGRKSFAGS